MWKKEDQVQPGPRPTQPEGTPPRNEAVPSRGGGRGAATIGRSITIRGEVTGDEDLLIEGRVEGSVDLKQHTVTVGPEGKVKAGITGRVVTVEGTVEGDLMAEEQVVLRSTARVQGDITAPRVVLEDGANFRGGVDMGEPSSARARGNDRASASRASGSSRSGAGETGKDAASSGASGESRRDAAESAGGASA